MFNQLLGLGLSEMLLPFLFSSRLEKEKLGLGGQLYHFSSWTVADRQTLLITQQPQ